MNFPEKNDDWVWKEKCKLFMNHWRVFLVDAYTF